MHMIEHLCDCSVKALFKHGKMNAILILVFVEILCVVMEYRSINILFAQDMKRENIQKNGQSYELKDETNIRQDKIPVPIYDEPLPSQPYVSTVPSLESLKIPQKYLGLGHHFTWMTGIQFGYFSFVEVLSDQKSSSEMQESNNAYDSRFFGWSLRYSYHLPLFASLNYFVGSEIEWYSPFSMKSHRYNISFISNYNIPSFMLAVVWNISSVHRLWLSGEYALRIIEMLYHSQYQDDPKQIQFMANDIDVQLQWVVMLSSAWSVSLSATFQTLDYSRNRLEHVDVSSSYVDLHDQSLQVMFGVGFRI